VCQNLESYIEKYRPDFHVLKTCSSVHCALESLQTLSPDLVLLDINLGSRDSFELINEIKETTFELIFITGHDEYALTALKYADINHLLKPICHNQLDTALDKAKEKIISRKESSSNELVKQNLLYSEKDQTKIIIPETSGYEFVFIRDIIRCEGWSKYTKVFLINGRLITSSYNLGHYRKLLAESSSFHCHKSHLINTKHIQRYTNTGIVHMRDGSVIPVSRRKKEQFLSQVIKNNFLFPNHILRLQLP